ncbi:MAG: hypothetical protein M0R46_12395 [Candidatus Muirbacterium halophilum]|nr:hypothetical protein [Candidatus Muirbacterium halophilum]MCK9476716.1 hypothetical protein [Candidatus Muirbacterium halophilum]
MKKDAYVEYSRIAIISSLWAASEVFIGNMFHQLNLPFKGMMLTVVPCFLLAFAFFYLKKPSSIMKVGITVAVVRMLLSWKFNPNIAMSILCQSAAFYISIKLLGKNLLSSAIGGMLAQSWTYFQSYFFRMVFMGYNLEKILEHIRKIEIIQPIIEKVVLVFVVLWLIHVIPGIIAGLCGFKAGKNLSSEK